MKIFQRYNDRRIHFRVGTVAATGHWTGRCVRLFERFCSSSSVPPFYFRPNLGHTSAWMTGDIRGIIDHRNQIGSLFHYFKCSRLGGLGAHRSIILSMCLTLRPLGGPRLELGLAGAVAVAVAVAGTSRHECCDADNAARGRTIPPRIFNLGPVLPRHMSSPRGWPSRPQRLSW